jgi:hypothetical protein
VTFAGISSKKARAAARRGVIAPVGAAAMGKKKRGKRNKDNNNTASSHHRVAGGHDDQFDTILNSTTDVAESTESPTEEVIPFTTLSIGDTVKINGLVNASEYNGMTGVIVSAVDNTTNRCGVRITGKSAKVMAIQVTNLTLEVRAKSKLIIDLATIRNTSADRVEGIVQSQMELFFAKQVMEDIPLCKEDGVKIVLSYLGAGDRVQLNGWGQFDPGPFQQTVLNNGLISVVLGFLEQCEHGDFSDMVDKVKGNQRTPVDWIKILSHLSTVEQCKLEIACGIEAVVRCMCDDTKRLFFKSNKYWHEAVPQFLSLVSNLLRPSSGGVSLNVSTEAAAVYDILLMSEGSFESIVQKLFWSSYRPDLLKEYESYHFSVGIKKLETFAYDVIRFVISIGKKRHWNKNDGVLIPSISLMNLTKKIAKTPVVSRAYDPECNVYFVVGMIRMLKNVNLDDSVTRKCYFETLVLAFTTLMFTADCIDNDVIVEVIDLGRNFTT